MKITDLLSENCILLDISPVSKEEAWDALSHALDQHGVLLDKVQFLKDIQKRELQGTTGVGFGVAIPHAKSPAVKQPALAMARFKTSIDVNSLDGSNASIMFMIAAPSAGEEVHLHALAKLARMLVHESFLNDLRAAKSAAEIKAVIAQRES